MRLLVDTVIALILVAILGAVLWTQRLDQQRLEQVALVQQAMAALESQALYRAAIGEVHATSAGFAHHLSPAWFDHLPQNPLVDHREVPWVDSHEDVGPDRLNPRHIVADSHHAGFWYNPYRGLIRARVPMQLTWASTVELYNLVNGTTLRVEEVDWHGAQICLEDSVDPTTTTVEAGDPVLRALGGAPMQ